MKKILTVALVALLIAAQSLAACTIFAVGKDASVDGSTMTSHTCDSNGDDLRLWLIPSMEAGTVRDVVVNGRAGADYGQFPAVKDYGPGMILGSYTFEEDSNQYVHAMYSFLNDKGVAMGESTCVFDFSSEHGRKIYSVMQQYEGIYDCYMLQDLALEVCDTAREAVEFMGAMISEYGWNGVAECINICDGEEAWVLEAYLGNQWVAVRVPDDAVFVAANRCRIDYLVEDDPENYLYSPTIKSFAIETGLWDGEGEFSPCDVYCRNNTFAANSGCILREWRALSLLDSDLDLDPYGDPDEYPLWVVPDEKVSVDTIHKLCSDYYAGTEFDCSRTVQSGDFGDPMNPNNVYRPINMFRATYVQISNIKSWLADEAKALVWVGWGAPITTYLTPVFAASNELAPHFGIGLRAEYDENSGWWVAQEVQQTARINFNSAIQDVRAVRDPKMAQYYKETAIIQDVASSMIEAGMKDQAVNLLTTYQNNVATDWHETYKELNDFLTGKYMNDLVSFKVPSNSQWWKDIVNENIGDGLKPLN